MGSPSRNVQYHPPRLSEDRLNLPQPHSPSLPTHCTAPGNRECARSIAFRWYRVVPRRRRLVHEAVRSLLDKVCINLLGKADLEAHPLRLWVESLGTL